MVASHQGSSGGIDEAEVKCAVTLLITNENPLTRMIPPSLNESICRRIVIAAAWGWLCLNGLSSAESVDFIPATPANTTLADGSPLPEPRESIGWRWQPDKGHGGLWESITNQDAPAAILMMHASRLQPGTVYEVFGYFWQDDGPVGGAAGQPQDAVQLGLSLAMMHPFAGSRPDDLVQKEPWVITPGYQTGQAFGYEAVEEKSDPLPDLTTLTCTQGNARLIRARLGFYRAGKDGTLPVFFSANFGSRSPGVARMNGIALRRAPADASPNHGRAPGTQLHLAVRAGDLVTIRREIEAGANLNAFDEEKLTPLFYAAAAGEKKLVEILLQHGAKPEQSGQSVSPLTAAATIAHEDIIRSLLKHGAKVPTKPTTDQGALSIKIDPRRLHPLVAAIHSGSVPVLRLLLEANQEIQLPQFEQDLDAMHSGPTSQLNSISLTGDTMLRMDWEMAAFLIDHGVSVTCRNSGSSPEGVVLGYAVQALPDSKPAMEAMLRRGEPAVTHGEDALNTAALHGNSELVRRFLQQAKDVGRSYQNGLLENAIASRNEDVIAMVRNQFPDAQAPRWAPDATPEQTPALEESAKRWFLPRTSPPPGAAEKPAGAKHVLAVVASPDSQGVGDILAVHASQSDAWQVVDREQIETAWKEGRFSKPWSEGEHQLAELGDFLKADCLIVLSAIQAGKETLHRLEVVETATGMEIHREHVRSDALVDPKEIAGILERTTQAIDAATRNQRHQAVTLLSFSPQGAIRNPLAVTGLLRAAIQHEVDSTAGMISMDRKQSARLIEEQALDGKNSVWGAAHTLEGSISAQDDGSIRITLRLETFQAGNPPVKTDAEATGKATEIAETARAAWQRLLSSHGKEITLPAGPPADRDRALAEGRRLMREADWLHAIYADPQSYLPMIESALALGVPARETILLDLDARFRHLLFLFQKNSSALSDRNNEHTSSLQHIPDLLTYQQASLARSDQIAHHLPQARALLHQTSWYLEHMGPEGLEGGTDLMQVYGAYQNNEIWYAIQALSAARAFMAPAFIPDHLREDYTNFCDELDALTTRYFAVLKTVTEPDFYRYYLQIADFRMIKHNPALASGLTEMAAASASPALLLRMNMEGNRKFQWMQTCRELAQKIVVRMAQETSPGIAMAKADIECFLAEPSQRTNAVRRFAQAAAEARWHTQPTRNQNGTFLVSQEILSICSTSGMFDWEPRISSLEHNGSIIPSVLFSAQFAPDLSIRFHTYHKIFHIINQREAWANSKSEVHFDSFRANIGGYDPWELRRLKAIRSDTKPSNGIPSQTGFTLQHGPPGTMAKPAAKELNSLVFGAAKKPATQREPEKPVTEKPQPVPLQASLLADLRITGSPGTIIWPMVDKTDPNLLWVFHFASDRDAICVNQAGGEGALNSGPVYDKRILYSAPWLLCIDCRTGSLIHKINLHSAVGEAYGIDLSNRKCDVWRMALDQTNDRILTRVGWHHENYSGNKMGSVIIDKKTGKAHPIPRNPEISSGKGDAITFDHWNGALNGVAAVGDHFFFLDNAGEWTGGAIKGVRSSEHAIFQVLPDLTVQPLTLMGRRPELTPFDAENRAPIAITPHGERLRVMHPATVAEYDPVANAWTIIASLPAEKPSNKHTNPVVDAHYWEHLRSVNEIRINGAPTEWIAVSLAMQHGVLPFASREKGWRRIPIEVVIPEDFFEKTQAIEELRAKDGTTREKQTRMKDHPRFKKPIPVVIAQTDTDLILGVQTNDDYGWKNPSRNSHQLPFLWKVSKQEILQQLNND